MLRVMEIPGETGNDKPQKTSGAVGRVKEGCPKFLGNTLGADGRELFPRSQGILQIFHFKLQGISGNPKETQRL